MRLWALGYPSLGGVTVAATACSTHDVRNARRLSILLLLPWLEVLAQPIGSPITLPPNVPGTGPPIIVNAPCKPIEVGSVPARIHLKCEKPLDNRFNFFYLQTADDPRFAARALSVIEAAQLGDKFLTIQFDARFTLGNQLGCPLGELCRPLLAVTMVETPISTPGRCAFDPNRVGCPAYCANTDDVNCPGFCTRHPGAQDCGKACVASPDNKQCADFCAANPNDALCGQLTCYTNPFGNTCRRFCAAAPGNIECLSIKEECLSPWMQEFSGCPCVLVPNGPGCQ
jgi:hypothetical protein